jgi:hypothetical protein
MKDLLLHGAVVFLVGLTAGVFYWMAILRNDEDARAHWRVAHAFLVVEGMFILLVGLSIPHVVLDDQMTAAMVWITIVSGYAFVFAFVVGASKRIRGLAPVPIGLNTLLFAGHSIGATGSVVTTAMLIMGFFEAL